jgi:hypothetical protein
MNKVAPHCEVTAATMLVGAKGIVFHMLGSGALGIPPIRLVVYPPVSDVPLNS